MGGRESCSCQLEDSNYQCWGKREQQIVHIEDFNMDNTIAEEIFNVFRACDWNNSGTLDSKKEVLHLIETLRGRGYVLMDGSHDTLTCRRIWEQFDVDNDGQLSHKEFYVWFKGEVINSKENLNTLLTCSQTVKDMTQTFHDDSDLDHDGTVDLTELTQALLKFYDALGEPAPDERELEQAASNLMKEHDGDVNGALDVDEFRRLFIPLMASIYYEHFNESMTNPALRPPVRVAKGSSNTLA